MATTEQQIYNGNRAKEVLENPAFLDAFEAIEQEVIEQWKNSPARDADGREKLWSYLMMLRKVHQHLKTTLETGQLAAVEINYKRSLVEKVTDVFL